MPKEVALLGNMNGIQEIPRVSLRWHYVLVYYSSPVYTECDNHISTEEIVFMEYCLLSVEHFMLIVASEIWINLY